MLLTAIASFIPSVLITFFMMLIKGRHGDVITFYILYPTGAFFVLAWVMLFTLIWRFISAVERHR